MAVGQPASTEVIGDLLSRLRILAKGRETIDVAQLHFIDLEKIQRAYGDRWAEHKSRILDSAESFLRKRVCDTDLLVRGEGGFLVVMGSAAGPEAHASAAQLTHGLNAFFTGEVGTSPAPRFGVVVQAMPARGIEKGLAAAGSAKSSTDNSRQRSGPADAEWKFEPVWDVRREALSYRFVTPFSAVTGQRIAGYQFETGAMYATQFVNIDEAGLWIAEQALLDLARAGKQALVGTTVHVNSLTSHSARARILATIDRLDPNQHRYRILKIAGVSHGFPRIYLEEIIGALRSRIPNIVLLATWNEPEMASLLHPGLLGVGIVTPGSSVLSGPVVAIPAFMARVNAAVKMAHGARMRFFVEGAVTKYLALKFSGVGVDNIASPGIWQASAMAEGVERWPANRLAAA